MKKKFEHWLNNSLKVRPYPNLLDLANKYIIGETQIIINVSDSIKPEIYSTVREMGLEYFWFPMNESIFDIGLNSIYGACVVLWNAEQENKQVLVHCWGGNNRSQIIVQAYYYIRTNNHLITEYKGCINQLIYNCEKGYLPPINKMEKFLDELSLKFQMELKGGELDEIKLKIK